MRKSAIIIFTVCLMTAAWTAHAVSSSFVGGAFTDNGISVRPLGLGGAYTAIADDADASWWNPAGLAFLYKKKSVSFTYDPSLFNLTAGGASSWLVSYGQGDLSGYGALGASISDMSVKIGADYPGDNQYSWDEWTLVGSWAIQIDNALGLVKYLYPKLAIGVNAKYLIEKSNLDSLLGSGTGATGPSFDLGLMLALKENLRIGIMAKDIYSDIKWDSGTSEQIPYELRTGIYYGITDNFLISGEIKSIEDDKGVPEIQTYSGGSEYTINFGKNSSIEKASIRAGISIDPIDNADILAGGASICMQDFSLDYTYQYVMRSVLDNTQRFGLSMTF